MAKRGKIEQELVNRIKIARALTRLKHSLAADNELNDKLDDATKKYFKQIQAGKQPTALSVEAFEKAFDVE